MAVYKEEKTNTWRVIYRYTDWTGERKQSQKRGFKTKREALAWEREQLNKTTADLDMTLICIPNTGHPVLGVFLCDTVMNTRRCASNYIDKENGSRHQKE